MRVAEGVRGRVAGAVRTAACRIVRACGGRTHRKDYVFRLPLRDGGGARACGGGGRPDARTDRLDPSDVARPFRGYVT